MTSIRFILIIYAIFVSSCGSSSIELIPVKSGGRSSSDQSFQYIDKDGKIIINPQFKDACVFRDGLALVLASGDNPKYGYIKKDGNFIINANYKYASNFHEGIAWVVKENEAPEAISKDGKTIFTLKQAQKVKVFSEGLAAFSVEDSAQTKWGFVDAVGATVINPQFNNCSQFSEGLCAVGNKENKWGFVDKKGVLKITYQFEKASDFENGKAIVTSGNKYGVIDDDGRYVINPQFDDMAYDGDLFRVQKDNKWGWCDQDGKFVINTQFEQAGKFGSADIAPAKSGKQWGFVNKEGKYEINPQFKAAFSFANGIAPVQNDNEDWGFIDTKGKLIINPQFKEIATDYLYFTYYNTRRSLFNQVESDFFDVSALTKRINLEFPEGLRSTSTMSDAAIKFGKSAGDFRLYSNEHQMLSNIRINSDISMNFYVIGNASKQETISNGYYQYQKSVFNASAPISGFVYSIDLSGKGNGKGKSVFDAIAKILTTNGYKKDETQYSINKEPGTEIFLKDVNKVILIKWQDNNIIMVIFGPGMSVFSKTPEAVSVDTVPMSSEDTLNW